MKDLAQLVEREASQIGPWCQGFPKGFPGSIGPGEDQEQEGRAGVPGMPGPDPTGGGHPPGLPLNPQLHGFLRRCRR